MTRSPGTDDEEEACRSTDATSTTRPATMRQAEAMKEPELVEVEFDSRAMAKIHRAATHFRNLEDAIDGWNEEHQLYAPMRSPLTGPQSVEFYRPATLAALPLLEWEATFHDGVQNVRSALDVLCSELAHLEGPPPKPSKIVFPVTEHPNQWPKVQSDLASLPAEILDRLRQCQPWGRPDRQSPDPLRVIAAISNWDKHRVAGAQLAVVPRGQWDLRPQVPMPPGLTHADSWLLPSWMRMSINPPLERGLAALMPVAAVPMVLFQGLQALLPNAQRWMLSEARRMVEFVATGNWEPAAFERFQPGPVWSLIEGAPTAGQ